MLFRFTPGLAVRLPLSSAFTTESSPRLGGSPMATQKPWVHASGPQLFQLLGGEQRNRPYRVKQGEKGVENAKRGEMDTEDYQSKRRYKRVQYLGGWIWKG